MDRDLRIIFFGSPGFAARVLRTLIEAKYPILCVVTQADRPSGRHLKLHETEVKTLAKQNALEVLCPQNLSNDNFLDKISKLSPDLFVVVSYGLMLPKTILKIPKLFALNIHASLLPEYRGAAPIHWQIINGETTSGISLIRMNESMDQGDIISQASIPIEPSETALSLENKLSKLACSQILKTLKIIESEKVSFTKQENSKASFAPKLRKVDGLIDWSCEASVINNQIRGCISWPVAFTFFRQKRVKIFSAQVVSEFQEFDKPGEIISLVDKYIIVATGKLGLKITELQMENSKRVSSAEFISGTRIKVGEIFGR
jgi:methionyl-tRNA formyltransferase